MKHYSTIGRGLELALVALGLLSAGAAQGSPLVLDSWGTPSEDLPGCWSGSDSHATGANAIDVNYGRQDDPGDGSLTWRDPVLGTPVTRGAPAYNHVSCVPTNPVPEPASLLLVGSGLAMVGLVGHRRRKRAAADKS